MMEAFGDKPPRKEFWLAFKVSSLERLNQMQNGLLYMNSLEYFSRLPSEELLPLRSDDQESLFGIWRAGQNGKVLSTLSISIDGSKDEIDLGPEAVLTASLTDAKNYVLFCMGSFVDSDRNNDTEGEFQLDERFASFGTHILLINNSKEFGNRISKAIAGNEGVFGTSFTHDGVGLVSYKDLSSYFGSKGLYIKDERYSWQRELRLVFRVDSHMLNKQGAFELNIGDISDISTICTVQSLIDEPIKFKMRKYKIVDSKPLLIDN